MTTAGRERGCCCWLSLPQAWRDLTRKGESRAGDAVERGFALPETSLSSDSLL